MHTRLETVGRVIENVGLLFFSGALLAGMVFFIMLLFGPVQVLGTCMAAFFLCCVGSVICICVSLVLYILDDLR